MNHYCPTLTTRPFVIQKIMCEVADKHGLTVDDIKGPRRIRPIVRARHEAMRRAWEETQHTYSAIGRRFNRDHTTVHYAINGKNR